MLNTLRDASKGWTAKILLGLLIASFAVWGVSGAFVNRTDDVVVAAGETTVSSNQYRLAYNRTLNQLGQGFGTQLTPEQAAAFGIDRIVLSELVSGAVLDEQSRELALGITDDELARAVAEDPAFEGIGGRFDRSRFRSILRSIGMTEQDYLDERMNVARRQQLLTAIANDANVPVVYAKAKAALDGQSRDVSFVRVAPSSLDEGEPPTEAEITAFFEENVADYGAPEYRTIRTVAVTPESVADPSTVDDAAVRAEYDASLARFTEPAARDVQQLLFPDRAAADAAAARLADGSVTFDDLITELGADPNAITIRNSTADNYPDQTVADAAFALSEGETTPVQDGRFGPVILRAQNVREDRVTPFEEVADDLRREIAARDATDIVFDVSDAYEDARAGGATLEEAAAEHRLEVVTIGPVDAAGLGPDGTPIDLPEGVELLGPAFEADQGAENEALQPPTGGFLWYEVASIEPARERALDEVRERVVADFQTERSSERLATLARELETELRGGTDLAAVASRLNATVENAFAVRRDGGDGLSVAAATAAFAGPEGHIALVPEPDGTSYVLLRVSSVVDDAALSAVEPPDAEEDILQQFVNDLERRYRPTYNAALAERVRAL